jgi:hypothetical protein
MADFTDEELRDFTVRKEILMESDSDAEVNRAEVAFIHELRSNDPGWFPAAIPHRITSRAALSPERGDSVRCRCTAKGESAVIVTDPARCTRAACPELRRGVRRRSRA